MKRYLLGIALFAALFVAGFVFSRKDAIQVQTVKQSHIAMETVVEVQVRHAQKERAEEAISEAFAEIRRVEALFTHFDPRSPIAIINRSVAESFPVSPEVFNMMRQCETLWRDTSGAFDASLGAVIDLWGFHRAEKTVPQAKSIVAALRNSGWRHVRLKEEFRVGRTAPVKFDFGSIAKGYAVDRAASVLRRKGMKESLVNAGGEIRSTGGTWLIGIQHPRKQGEMVHRLKLCDMAVATSGDYEQYFEKDGKRYHHILDPRTGFPAEGCRSATVLAADDATADALATGFFVLGAEKSMQLVKAMPGVHALVIDQTGRIHMSRGFADYLVH